MKVAVWDTYVPKKDGNVMHFDIIAPDNIKDGGIIYQFGKDYLTAKNEENSALDTDECQLCHIEEPSAEMIESIANKGYYILEMAEIPAILPQTPTRRDIIFHLRAFHKSFRFADFKDKTLDDVQNLLAQIS